MIEPPLLRPESVHADLTTDGATIARAWLRSRTVADVLGRRAGENFPVALRLLPAVLRRDLLAVYAYARLVDDIGDEAPGDRDAALDLAAADLERVWDGRPELPVLAALVPTVRGHELAPQPFRDLLAANRVDQRVRRYATYDDLLGYCRRSADPVGRIVLGLAGALTPDRIADSDRVCTALQLLEHVQDVGEDLARDRIYLPAEDLDRHGVTAADLALPVASPQVRRLVAFEARRARDLLQVGGPRLVASLAGWSRLAVAGFVGGGLAAYDAVERAGFDTLGVPPKPSRAAMIGSGAGLWARSFAPGRARS